jgi:hypothetical protein
MEITDESRSLQQALSHFAAQLEQQQSLSDEDGSRVTMLIFIGMLLKSIENGKVYKLGWRPHGVGNYITVNIQTPIEDLSDVIADFSIEAVGPEAPIDDSISSPSINNREESRFMLKEFTKYFRRSAAIDESDQRLARQMSDMANDLRVSSDKEIASIKEMQSIADRINEKVRKHLNPQQP